MMRTCGVLLAFAAMAGVCNGEDEPLDAERVATILLARSGCEDSTGINFEYDEAISLRGQDNWSWTYRLQWRVRGFASDADVWCRLIPSEGDEEHFPQLQVRRGQSTYYAVLRSSEWTSWRGRLTDLRFDNEGPIRCYLLQPVERAAWADTLRSHPPIAAWREGEGGIGVLLPFSAGGEAALRAGRPVTGILGWRCRVRRIGDRYDLISVEQVGTAEVAASEGGQVVWHRNPALLSDVPLFDWPGGVECGVTQIKEFAQFIALGDALRVPLRVTTRSTVASSEAEVNPGRLRIVDVWPDATFDFVPPSDFGAVGTHTDLETGRTFVRGHSGDPSRVVDGLLRRGRELGNSTATGESVNRRVWAVSVGASILLIVVVGGVVWRKSWAKSRGA